MFIPACILVSIAVNGGRYPLGVAHICLQPLLILGIALLAVELPGLPAPLRWAAIAGATIDFALGIFLHFSVENALPGITPHGRMPTLVSLQNWQLKQLSNQQFIGDHAAPFSMELQVLILVAFAVLLAALIREAKKPGHAV
jgi:hypothetical protein